MALRTLKIHKIVSTKDELAVSRPAILGEKNAAPTADEVAQRTRELLDTEGWCLWKCSILNGDIIVIARDEEVKGYPKGYPVYTDLELRELCRGVLSEGTLRIVHEAKKLAGAMVTKVEDSC